MASARIFMIWSMVKRFLLFRLNTKGVQKNGVFHFFYRPNFVILEEKTLEEKSMELEEIRETLRLHEEKINRSTRNLSSLSKSLLTI